MNALLLLTGVAWGGLPDVEAALQDEAFRELFVGTVLITSADGDILVHAAGSDRSGQPLDVDSPAWLASISKHMASAALLQLAAEGKVALDAPVGPLLGMGAQGLQRDGVSCTVEHLLSHQCGLPGEVSARGVDPLADPQKLVAQAAALSLNDTPGTAYSYSNVGYDLAGLLVQELDGRPYGDALHARLFSPLELTQTGVSPGRVPDLQARTAAGHFRAFTFSLPSQAWLGIPWDAPAHVGPSGMAFSTARELDRWFQSLLGGAVLPPEWVSQMTTPRRHDYGLGLVIEERPYGNITWHNGALTPHGYSTFVGHAPSSGTQVTVLMPLSPEILDATRIGVELMDGMHDVRMRTLRDDDRTKELIKGLSSGMLVVLPPLMLLWAGWMVRRRAAETPPLEWALNFGLVLSMMAMFAGMWSPARLLALGIGLGVLSGGVSGWLSRGTPRKVALRDGVMIAFSAVIFGVVVVMAGVSAWCFLPMLTSLVCTWLAGSPAQNAKG